MFAKPCSRQCAEEEWQAEDGAKRRRENRKKQREEYEIFGKTKWFRVANIEKVMKSNAGDKIKQYQVC